MSYRLAMSKLTLVESTVTQRRRALTASSSGLTPAQPRYFRSTSSQYSSTGLARSLSLQELPKTTMCDNPPTVRLMHSFSINEPGHIRTEVHGLQSRTSSLDKAEQATEFVEPSTVVSPPLATPVYHHGLKFDRVPYWQKIDRWKDVPEKMFLSHRWSTAKDIQGKAKLYEFLKEVLPKTMPTTDAYEHIRTREAFIQDVMEGIAMAPMSIRLTPHILASIDWNNPLEDPLSRQFIPKKSTSQPDHPRLELDSLHETEDSPCEGLVHRYPDKCLFLASSHCPTYCKYCTRSYAVGADTETVTKASLKPKRARWEEMFAYISRTPAIQDVVISGGDSYSLMPQHLRHIGERLLEIPHVRRFRVATKGLCVSPSRTLDVDDTWTDELIELTRRGRERGKQVALHTHFNHSNEITWVTREAAQRLFSAGVIVRNQSVLLRGVNDSPEAMGTLIRELADNNIQPYYIYLSDMVRGIEDLRTPLQSLLTLESQLRGTIAGFMTPQFVVDLPGGGGKRLAATYETYDKVSGRSTFLAPAVKDGQRVYEYWDPEKRGGDE